jgi:hypothetical protein
MPVDLTALNEQVTALTAQVEQTEGVEASAMALISGFAAAIQKAVEADNAIDAANTAKVVATIAAVKSRFMASATALGAAVAANPQG